MDDQQHAPRESRSPSLSVDNDKCEGVRRLSAELQRVAGETRAVRILAAYLRTRIINRRRLQTGIANGRMARARDLEAKEK